MSRIRSRAMTMAFALALMAGSMQQSQAIDPALIMTKVSKLTPAARAQVQSKMAAAARAQAAANAMPYIVGGAIGAAFLTYGVVQGVKAHLANKRAHAAAQRSIEEFAAEQRAEAAARQSLNDRLLSEAEQPVTMDTDHDEESENAIATNGPVLIERD